MCWVGAVVLNFILVFKRVVPLRIWHRTTVKPNIDQVTFAVHRLAARAYQHNAVHDVTMQIYFIVVLFTHIAGLKGPQRVAAHVACRDGFLDLFVELGHAANTKAFISLLGAPNR